MILCGGLGKRLRSVIGHSQKILANIDGEPFLNVLLKDLKRQGFRRVILCTGFQAQSVAKYYRENNLGLTILFSRERTPLGTGGAIRLAKRFVKSEPFVVLNGDSFCRIDYKKFLSFHHRQRADAAIAVAKVNDRRDYGSIRLDQRNRVVAFLEKNAGPESKRISYVNAGVYCFNRDVFRCMPRAKKFSLEKEFFPQTLDKKVLGFKVKNNFIDIGTPQRYKIARNFLKKKK